MTTPRKLTATAASLSNGTYQVVFNYVDAHTMRQDFTMPSFNVPCLDLDHAFAVAYAFNNPKD